MRVEKYDEKDSGKVYIWALMLPIIVSIIIGIALNGSPKDESGNYTIFNEIWFNYLLQILSGVLLLGLYFFYTKSHNISYKACGITKKPNNLMLIICVVVGIGLCFLTDKFISLIAIFLDHIGVKINSTINIPLSNFGEYALALLIVAVLPAVCEELVYRGIILNGLRKYGKWTAILLSALAFCLMHGNLAQFPYTFLLGIVLGYVMFETSSLILCITIHFFNNATVLTQMFIHPESTIPETVSATYVVEAIVLLLVAIAIVILAFYLIAKINNREKNSQTVLNENPEEKTEQKKINKEKKLLTKNEKFKTKEISIPEINQSKKANSGIIMLIVGYAIAICLTIINLI